MFSSTIGGGMPGRLVGPEIHGFHTVQDLDVEAMFVEAKARWLRPNEIHAILCNHKLFPILVKPVNLPESGTILLFDRKMLRNFRKDGHNWKKKKDGKTIKEAHEHLKVGNEERIHVYYAHGQDNPTFVRRCYWLLDKSLEHIVLVHYRQTQELQNSPVTPMNSNSSSLSEQLSPWTLSDELDSGAGQTHFSGEPSDTLTVKSHQMRLHELNTLDWDELVASESNIPIEPPAEVSHHTIQQNQVSPNASTIYDSTPALYNSPTEVLSMRNSSQLGVDSDFIHLQNSNLTLYNPPTGIPSNMDFGGKPDSFTGTGDSLDILAYDGLQNQNSFGRWMGNSISQSQGSSDGLGLESSIYSSVDAFASTFTPQSSVPEQIFVISDVSPAWAFSTEKTKILVTGYFHDQYRHLAKSNLYCACGDLWFPAEVVQDGVYRVFISPQSPGLVNLYFSLDKHNPISPILNFEYRAQLSNGHVRSSDDKSIWEEFGFQLRLMKLLLSTSKSLNILTSKVSPVNLKDAQKLDANTSNNIANSWSYFTNSIEERRMSFEQAKDGLFELTLKNLLKEWLLERVLEGCKATKYDAYGLGVIHLCAVLGYTWAIRLFSWSGLSLDFRDKHGWTALHWASYYGREKMVAVLLSAGADPSRITDPTPKNPGGCFAADLAYANGYEGLAAYLSEKALVAHLKAMSIAGNASGSLETISEDIQTDNKNLTEEEVCLKDTLAAYRTAADAAARIQSAFRQHSLKVRTQAVEEASPEAEARSIIAAMKIQHAFRNFDSRKKMAAAARIQYRFRTWKMRRDFLNLRRHTIKIQAYFRGFQVRRNYRKIIWSVGVLEKAVLRWRLKRKGFRGLQINENEATGDQKQDSDPEEDFYKTSRKQAEERVERSVIQVQAMFRSKKAQQDYQRMKMAHNQATREYEDPFNTDTDMNS